jgi:hypothetical protein
MQVNIIRAGDKGLTRTPIYPFGVLYVEFILEDKEGGTQTISVSEGADRQGLVICGKEGRLRVSPTVASVVVVEEKKK